MPSELTVGKRQLFYLATERIMHKYTQLCQNHNKPAKFINLKQKLLITQNELF